MIKISGANSIITLNIHSKDLCIYSDIPIINFDLEILLMNAVHKELLDYNSSVIIAPDAGGSIRCIKTIQNSNLHGAIIHKGSNLI